MYYLLPKYRGSALLTALFIMTLVAIVATAISGKIQSTIYRTRLIIEHDQLYFAAQAVNFWAMSELNQKKLRFTHSTPDGLVAPYPNTMKQLITGIEITGGLYDLQSRVNLNNLNNKKYILNFINFISQNAPDIAASERAPIALALLDWISPYNLGTGTDQYLSYYLKQKPPYHTAHQLFASTSELRLIQGITAKAYLNLMPYTVALPEPTPLNINTASKEALMSLSNIMDEPRAQQIIEARGQKGFKQMTKINELLQKFNIAQDQITLESKYYLAVARTHSSSQNLTLFFLLKRVQDKKGQVYVFFLRQIIGQYP